jgi:micrococcal nuclease
MKYRSNDRLVVICYREGKGIGITIVEARLALDCPSYSGGRYKSVEPVVGREQIKLSGYSIK